MTGPTPSPAREDVLHAFAVEPNPSSETLERYLRAYPELAAEFVDLARELSRPVPQDGAPLSAEDAARVDAAWLRHRAVVAPGASAAPSAAPSEVRSPAVDPFASLAIDDLRRVAGELGVPRQVVTAFRERRVDVASVPRAFLARLASVLHSTREAITAALSEPAALSPGWSYKADAKPVVEARIPFERLLREAGVADAERDALLRDDG